MAVDRYLIGPGLKSKLGDVIRTVDGLASPGGGMSSIPTRFEEPLRAAPGKGPFRACMFSGLWNITQQKIVTSISTGETFNVTNLMFESIPNLGVTLNCAIAKDGTAWYLVNAEHRTTNAITKVLIEGGSFVFRVAEMQAIAATAVPTTFALDVCETYTSTATTTTASGQAASFAATSFFFG